jgi:branched-chain amino acid aminotransferase
MLQRYDERNADIVYWVNGVLRHRDEPGVSPFDSVVQGGDAVWEGLRVYDGTVFGLREHLTRLRHSALALGFSAVPSDMDITAAIRETLQANGMSDGVHIRLTLTRGVKLTSGMDPRLNTAGCTLIVLAEFKQPVYDISGLRLVTASVRRPGPDVLDPKIHHNNLLNSILAKIEANVAGADDALMLDSRGFVAETNATNLFAVIDAGLVTPRTVACPEGITRQTVLALAEEAAIPVEARDVSLAEFYRAEEVFCTGTMGEIAGIVAIDGRPIGAGVPGVVTRRVAQLYADHVRAHGVPL